MVDGGAVRLAEAYLVGHARVLERRRFAVLFGGEDPAAAVAALEAYRNADGGYGHALEPDGRGPGSQPLAVLMAVGVLGELGALTAERVAGICDHLTSITADDGGVPFVHPNIEGHPRAPWWAVPEVYEGSLVPTANLVGALREAGAVHPWLDRAAEFCWARIEGLTGTHPYEALGSLAFLDHAPERERARRAAERLGELVRGGGLVRVGDAPTATPPGYSSEAEVPFPHEYARTPGSLACGWFDDAELAASLDGLVASRGADGAWRPRWPMWNPVVGFEWAGVVTIEALLTLRAHGRLGG